MGRLIVSANMTTDMVIDPLEGWFQPNLGMADGLAQLIAADALILGRKTYKKLADFWPKSDDEWAELINPMPKHVASRTLEGPLTWNSQLLGADIAGEVANLKSRYSGDLILYGIGELANYLARQDLVDEVRFWVHPVIWGDGVRALPRRRASDSTAPDLGDNLRVGNGAVGIPADGVPDHGGGLI